MNERRWMNRARTLGSALLLSSILAASGCSSSTAPANRPTEARIRVTGTAPAALRLVVSTDFVEGVTEDGQVFQAFNRADTTQITSLPYDQTVPLTSLGSVVVEVTNVEVTPAQVRLRVDLDGGQEPYDQSAEMSDGGTLRYVFAFLTRVL